MADNIQEVIIDTFAGGMSNSPNTQSREQFAFSQAFDIWQDQNKLIPALSLVDDSTSATADDMLQYDIKDLHFVPGSTILYGLGRKAASDHPKIFSKSGDPLGAWVIPGSAEGSQQRINGTFFEWQGWMYFFSGSADVSRYEGGTYTQTYATLANAVSRGTGHIISPTDNCAYMFYLGGSPTSPYVVRISATGTVSDNVLALPRGYRIAGSALYGNYIAIALSNILEEGGRLARSIVVLWDPTLSNFSEIIDFGSGDIFAFANIEGSLVAIMQVGTSTLTLTGGSVQVKRWGGGAVDVEKHFKFTSPISTILPGNFISKTNVQDNSMYFYAQMNINETIYRGIWRYGRKHIGLPFGFTLLHPSPIVDGTFSDLAQTWEMTNEYTAMVRSANNRIYVTKATSGYADASILESQIYSAGRLDQKNKVHSVFATFEALPAGAQVVMKYRKDAETSYTTLWTETTDGASVREQASGSGVTLPAYKKIQFRLESTGGAEITSWGFRHYPIASPTRPE